MFDSIYITLSEENLDLGFLAETLLFYNKVYIYSDIYTFQYLSNKVGPDNLIELIDSGFLNISYVNNAVAIIHDDKHDNKGLKNFMFVTGQFDNSPELPEIMQREFYRSTGKLGKSRRTAQKLAKMIPIVNYSPVVVSEIEEYLLDKQFLENSTKLIISSISKDINIPSDYYFTATKGEKGIFVNTNFDFASANQVLAKKKIDIPLSNAYLLGRLYKMKGHLSFASELNAEIALDEIEAVISKYKVAEIINKRMSSVSQIELFNNYILNAKAIRESINKGEVTFRDFLTVLEKSHKFRNWLRDIPNDKDILKEYYQKISSETVLDKLPGKILRFAFFNSAGFTAGTAINHPVIGTLAGLTINTFDSFIFDKLFSGWKPSQFIKSLNSNLN